MEGDPFVLIEGMTIAALAINATQGYIYLRSEYPHAERTLNEAISTAYKEGYLGADIRGSSKTFHLEVRRGAGAYICGEETALLESLEGKRGEIRYRPPLPAVAGLFGRPTILNNVISLASVPIIFEKGAAFYKNYGMGRSRGTLPFQLAGNLKRGGLVEKAFGITMRELLYDFGGGSSGKTHPDGTGRRAAWRLLARVAIRYSDGLRVVYGDPGAARPWGNGRIRRYGRYGAHGPIRHGVLCE